MAKRSVPKALFPQDHCWECGKPRWLRTRKFRSKWQPKLLVAHRTLRLPLPLLPPLLPILPLRRLPPPLLPEFVPGLVDLVLRLLLPLQPRLREMM